MLAVPFWKIGFFSTERTQSGRTKATLDAAPLLLTANATRLNKYKRLTWQQLEAVFETWTADTWKSFKKVIFDQLWNQL